MNLSYKRWGVELGGTERDREIWQRKMPPLTDVYVEEIKNEQGNFHILRSKEFAHALDSKEVHKRAKKILKTLNAIFALVEDADQVTISAVVEFDQDGILRKSAFVELKGISVRSRVGVPKLTVYDNDGNILPPEPKLSRAQLCMIAVSKAPDLESALWYLNDNPGWGELYKACEVLEQIASHIVSNK
ncbi:hypothetical protein PsW64_03654 [Pseudovibrio sp. W64]|uniref:hypothetical protein n=1 Tax=Pseudovibrio sp. W64 TaxID=1735583 RepID=UPI0007AE6229|nr:hypothetical protein [Pseudovibrio sp. W64]KZK78016.1 hypothetical protein PsW64_03654 [Pseudovibrio sp. W64]